MSDPEKRSFELYPDPINGNTFDKEDFEYRKAKAKIQREAYLRGYYKGHSEGFQKHDKIIK